MKRTKSKTRRRSKRAPMKAIKPNDEKFRELVIFIARRSEKDPRFGAIKLNKLLFYCDFLAYLKLGQPITGQPYFKLKQGPAPQYGTPLREKMIRDKEIAVRPEQTAGGRTMIRTLALRDPNYKAFSSQEIALVTQVLEEYRASSGAELSEESHRFAGWHYAKEREEIPYAVALVGNRLPTDEEIQRGIELQATADACLTDHAARGI